MKVKSVDGLMVEFDVPFDRTVRQWASFDEICSIAGEHSRPKTGAWEDISNGAVYKRGLGLDHGLVRFSHITRNVSLEYVTVDYGDGSPAPYGNSAIFGSYAHRVRFEDIRIRNPRGACIHMVSCVDSGVDVLDVIGNGLSNDWDDHKVKSEARLLALWGGENCYAKHLRADGRDIGLTNCEASTVNTLIENATIRTAYTAGYQPMTHFGVYGPHPGFLIKDFTLDAPIKSPSLIPILFPQPANQQHRLQGAGIPGLDRPRQLQMGRSDPAWRAHIRPAATPERGIQDHAGRTISADTARHLP